MPSLHSHAEELDSGLEDIGGPGYVDRRLALLTTLRLSLRIRNQLAEDQVLAHRFLKLLEVRGEEGPLFVVHVQERVSHVHVVRNARGGCRRQLPWLSVRTLTEQLPDQGELGWHHGLLVDHGLVACLLYTSDAADE